MNFVWQVQEYVGFGDLKLDHPTHGANKFVSIVCQTLSRSSYSPFTKVETAAVPGSRAACLKGLPRYIRPAKQTRFSSNISEKRCNTLVWFVGKRHL